MELELEVPVTYDAAPSELARRHEPPIYRSSVRDQGLQPAEATKVKSAMKKVIPETSGTMTSGIALPQPGLQSIR